MLWFALELVKLYDVSGFKLGDTLEDSIRIVQSIRSLSKNKLESVITNNVDTGLISISAISSIAQCDSGLGNLRVEDSQHLKGSNSVHG